jgi:hypothetical protein
MSENATVVLDQESDEIKIFVGGELKGRYKNRYECATHFASTLIRVTAMESVFLEIVNEDLPDWMRQKIRNVLSR